MKKSCGSMGASAAVFLFTAYGAVRGTGISVWG